MRLLILFALCWVVYCLNLVYGSATARQLGEIRLHIHQDAGVTLQPEINFWNGELKEGYNIFFTTTATECGDADLCVVNLATSPNGSTAGGWAVPIDGLVAFNPMDFGQCYSVSGEVLTHRSNAIRTNHVFIHEILHAAGQGHLHDITTPMSYGSYSVTLSAADIELLRGLSGRAFLGKVWAQLRELMTSQFVGYSERNT